jgi:SAM-dependent methyltransferase
MRGVRQIVRFNWPFYGAAALVLVAVEFALTFLSTASETWWVLHGVTGLAAMWIIGSLIASWVIYDRSPLTRWEWIGDAIGVQPRRWINVHAGLDESTPALRRLLAPSEGRVFDIFDPDEMSEPSIVRARRLYRPEVDPERVDFQHLPAARKSIDAAFLLLSAHELRTDAARRTFFGELHRILSPDGRVIVAEHLRDGANFAAFGPGFLHFFSRRTWARCFARARFIIDREFSITPFIRVFVLRTGRRATGAWGAAGATPPDLTRRCV